MKSNVGILGGKLMIWGVEYFCLTSAIKKLIGWTSSSAPPNSPSLRRDHPDWTPFLGVSLITTHHHNAPENAKSLINNESPTRITAIMLNWLFFDQLKSADRARPPAPFLKKKQRNLIRPPSKILKRIEYAQRMQARTEALRPLQQGL